MYAAEYRSVPDQKKACIARATMYQSKVNKLASIQYKLKHKAVYNGDYRNTQNSIVNLTNTESK